MKKGFSRKQIALLLITLLAALAIRIILVPLKGYERDIYWFKEWSFAAVKYGVVGLYSQVWCDYPPGYLYVLKAVGLFYKVFYPALREGTYLLQFLLKFPAIVADLASAALIFSLIKARWKFSAAYLGMLAYAFNPAVFSNSAWWGQTDSVMALLLLLSVAALLKKRTYIAYALLALAFFTKTQSLIFIPLIFYITWRQQGLKSVIKGIGVAFATVIILSSPFMYQGKMANATDAFLGAVDSYPFASMNAHNLWWLISGGQGTVTSDRLWISSIATYKDIGLLLFLAAYLVLIAYLGKKDLAKQDKTEIYFAFAFLSLSFYLLPTQMHERYIFPVFAFLALILVDYRLSRVFYCLLSLISCGTLMFVLSSRYSANTPRLDSLFKLFPEATMVFSVANILVFLYMLIFMFKTIGLKPLIAGLAISAVIVCGLYIKGKHATVDLSQLAPIKGSQDWGKLHINKSVDNNRLTVNGFIYKKGLGAHANSRYEYHTNGNYQYFETDFGADQESNSNNKVRFLVEGDGKMLYDSGLRKVIQNPVHIKIAIGGVNKLALITKDGGDGIRCDHTDWLNPRLIP